MSNWTSLTWDDLQEWAGAASVERGRSYQQQGRVRELCMSADERLLADVIGTRPYVTSVWWEAAGRKKKRELESRCTCPVGWRCKHAVAVVAQYLEMISAGEKPDETDDEDPRWDELEELPEDETDEGSEDDEEVEGERLPRRRSTGRKGRQITDEQIRADVQQKGHAELVELVMEYLARFPELRQEWRDRLTMASGNVEKLMKEVRRELREITREPAWRNSWTGEGYTPDYGRLIGLLQRLTEVGHADEVASFGREVVEQGFAQAGEASDEGETLTEVGRCVEVVLAAVAKSNMSGVQKLLYAIDVALSDDWGATDEALHRVLGKTYAKEEWSEVADTLARRLESQPKKRGDDFSSGYQRDRISRWVAEALEKAGRKEELLALYEREARATQSYTRLVEYLLRHRKTEDAMRWAIEGIAATRDKAPGIASQLAMAMRDAAARREQWDVVAAYEWLGFQARPSAAGYRKVVEAAAKAGCREAVEKWALRLLETGELPVRAARDGKHAQKVETAADWPLPVPEFLRPLYGESHYAGRSRGPDLGVLIDLAIEQGDPEEVLRRYDQMRATKPRDPGGSGWHRYADSVAEAVKESHPERALEIHKHGLEGVLGEASKSAYEAVGQRLKHMRPLYKALGRADQWDALVAGIRERYRNRPRLMEVLDRLAGRPIVQTKKRR